jgi:hypothetical protein
LAEPGATHPEGLTDAGRVAISGTDPDQPFNQPMPFCQSILPIIIIFVTMDTDREISRKPLDDTFPVAKLPIVH